MNKFNPEKVPKWCNWIAVDANGECFAHKLKPYPSTNFPEWLWGEKASDVTLLYKGRPPKDFKQELYTWK